MPLLGPKFAQTLFDGKRARIYFELAMSLKFPHAQPQATMAWQTKRLMIWGTTYPEFSKTYFETVCTGAIDGDTGRFVRIYPITLRHLEDRFRHYQWIEAEVERNTSDFRPESYRIRQDTMTLGEKIDTKDGWAERNRWVLTPGNVFSSLDALREKEAQDHTSLGLIKPAKVTCVRVSRKSNADREEWEAARKTARAQPELFVDVDANTRELQFVPLRYYVDFTCDSQGGPKLHKCAVLDWGLYVLHRKMVEQHGDEVGEQKVMDKIRDNLDPTKKDAYMFMGNSKAHCQNFSIVGFYYPPRQKLPSPTKAPSSTLSLPGFE